MKCLSWKYMAFSGIIFFGGAEVVSHKIWASDSQNKSQGWWQRQKEKRTTQRNSNVDFSQTPQQLQRKHTNSICGRCLNPVEVRHFSQEEINYCKKTCPDDREIQDDNFPNNIFKENILGKKHIDYGQEVNLIKLLGLLENFIGRESYRSCDQGLQSLYMNLQRIKDPTLKTDFEYKLRQIRQSFNDVKTKNMKKIAVLGETSPDLGQEEFYKNFSDMYLDYNLPAKNCRDYVVQIGQEINKINSLK